jgi:hypothetical protein
MDARNGSGGGAAVVDAAIAGCPNGFLVRRQSRLSRDPIEVKIKTRKKKKIEFSRINRHKQLGKVNSNNKTSGHLTLAQSGATCSRRDPPFLFCLF